MDRRDPILEELDDKLEQKVKNIAILLAVLALIGLEYWILWNL